MKPFSSLIIAISLILISTKSWSNDGNGFNHPGLFHSQNDLDRMREAVKAKEEPIFSGFKIPFGFNLVLTLPGQIEKTLIL